MSLLYEIILDTAIPEIIKLILETDLCAFQIINIYNGM